MLTDIYTKQKENNEKACNALKKEFQTIRSGKVNISILDNIMVDYYGSPTPLNQVASVLATDATTITINPWEKNMVKVIDSAIKAANIGVNPNADADGIKLFFPPMTKEQREENAKIAKAMGEKCKVAIRNIRKDANDGVKKLEKDKVLSEDEAKKAYDEIQKATDLAIAKTDELVKEKETQLLKV